MPSDARAPQTVLQQLTDQLDALPPEPRKAAVWLLENAEHIGVSSIREVAEAAQVKPNTLVRLARQIGFDGYDALRAPFREQIRAGTVSLPERARWLQQIKASGEMGGLLADMVSSALSNIEESFAGLSEASLRAAAEHIWSARKVYVLGVGVNNANAHNFTYLALTGMQDFIAIPRAGSTAIDDLARADERDLLIAMTFKPYRAEVVDAVEVAREQGVSIVAISDSPAAPILRGAAHPFVIATDTPQFFPSSVALLALLETLLSFVIAGASEEIVDRVERFHARRHALGLYREEPS